MNQYKKYKGIIEKIVLDEATFKRSTQKTIEPTNINYFYGNNGTGKSTVARALGTPVGLTWRSGNSENDFVIRVFSRDFVESELRFTDADPWMPSVLTIGKEFINSQNKLDENRAELKRLTEQNEKDTAALATLRTGKEYLRTKFIDDCWTKGKVFKDAFGGGKGDFNKKELCADRVKKTTPVQHDFAELKKRFVTATDPNARRYSLFAPLDLSKLDDIEAFSLLGESIVSTADSPFSRFMQSLEAVAWVKEGHENYSSKAEGKCPFCQQILQSDFESQLAECFNGKYTDDCRKIATFQQDYMNFMGKFISSIKQNIEALKSCPQGFGNVSEYEKNLALIEKTIAENNRRITAKVAKPSEIIKLDSLSDYLEAVNKLIAETNALFTKNNEIFDNKRTEEATCMTAVWELLAYDLKNVIQRYIAEDKDVDSKIAAQDTLVKGQIAPINVLNGEISQLSKKMGGSGATIQKVNDLLKATGFRGFQLVAHKSVPNRYNVVRDDGTPAYKLSEGERNFIAFLYFYHLVKGSWKPEDLHKGKIVVIDDPVSSMDSGVLSIVSALVRELIDDCFYDGNNLNIKQMFILTHNPYFHHAVSNSMLRPEEGYFKKIAFFEIRKNDDNISTVSKPCVQPSKLNDPDVLEENFAPVQNSYCALWQEYKDARLPQTLLHIINRIADYHFFQLCNYDREELKKKVTAHVGADSAKLKLVNELLQYVYEKAEDSIGSMIYYQAPSSIEDYRSAFRTVFVAMGQEAHYAKMSGEG